MKTGRSKNMQTAVGMLLILTLIITTMTDVEIPYLAVLVVVALCVMAVIHSRKTSIKEIVLDGEKVELVLTDGSAVMVHQRDVVRLKVSASRIVVVLRNKEDYNIAKKRANAVIRIGDEPLRELREDDFPFAEMKKALG